MGWLLVLGLKEGLVECATVCIKSEVILIMLITWWNKKSYCWKSSNFPWIRPVPFWIENLCEGMWCHFQWINFWIHSAFLYVSDFLSDANEGITITIKFGFGLRFGWFYVWKWRYLGSIRYISIKYGFRKKLLRYKSTSDQLNTFILTFFRISAGLDKKWGKKCSTGQRFICIKVTSYKIHTLEGDFLG